MDFQLILTLEKGLVQNSNLNLYRSFLGLLLSINSMILALKR